MQQSVCTGMMRMHLENPQQKFQTAKLPCCWIPAAVPCEQVYELGLMPWRRRYVLQKFTVPQQLPSGVRCLHVSEISVHVKQARSACKPAKRYAIHQHSLTKSSG